MNDERSLIARILSGDTAAWHTFIEIYSPHIRKTIRRYVADPEVENDLYASLLEKLKTEKLARFESRSSLATWLFAVTRNHCRDHYREREGSAAPVHGARRSRRARAALLQPPLHPGSFAAGDVLQHARGSGRTRSATSISSSTGKRSGKRSSARSSGESSTDCCGRTP